MSRNRKAPLPVRATGSDFSWFTRYSQTNPFLVRRTTLLPVLERAHHHMSIEVGMVLSESAGMYLNGTWETCKRGDVYFLDAGYPHGAEEGVLLVAEMKVPSLLSSAPVKGDGRILSPFIGYRSCADSIIRNSTVREYLLRALKICESDQRWPLRAWPLVLGAFYEIAAWYEDTYPENREVVKAKKVISDAVSYICEHFDQPTPVADIARHVNLSPSRLTHLFSESMRLSPIEYRNRLRIEHAIDLLMTSDATISNIGLECGFTSMNNFYAQFRKVTGKNPGDYRSIPDGMISQAPPAG